MVDTWTGRGPGMRTIAAVCAAGALLLGACSEAEEPAGATDGADGTQLTTPDGNIEASGGDGETVLSGYQGANWFNGEVPEPQAADDSQDPIRIGFINVDAAPIAAMPELHRATDAAAAFINEELGGVGGRPVEIVPCLLSNSLAPEEAAGCARKLADQDVTAVLGGIGLSTGAALAILEEDGIPWVGGIPVNDDEMRSPVSFQFSGGSPGAFTGFAEHAVVDEGAERVAVLYAEYPSIESAAVDYGAAVARARGAEVDEVSFPMTSQDFAAPVQKAVEGDPDAILVAAADLSCAPVIQAITDLGSDADVYMVGSCADTKVIDQVGMENVEGFRFNIENRLDQTVDDLADTEIYTAVMEKYAPDTTPQSAATVAFKGAMNLWAILSELGPDATSEDIVAAFRATEEHPSFDGHPYTCDGEQIPDLPSMCAAQQIIAELGPNGEFTEVSDGWIDVPTVLQETLG